MKLDFKKGQTTLTTLIVFRNYRDTPLFVTVTSQCLTNSWHGNSKTHKCRKGIYEINCKQNGSGGVGKGVSSDTSMFDID